MKIGIMQPYIFPYIGYFQLIYAVDKFILLDDVNFIKKGWINRNRILINGEPFLFTVPLQNASQNKLINDIDVIEENNWKDKFLKTILQAYKFSPYFNLIYPVIQEIILTEEKNISKLIYLSIGRINSILNINTPVVASSQIYNNRHLKGQERIVDICLKEKAGSYINSSGGQELYNKERFRQDGIELFFITSLLPDTGGKSPLSIIHLLMNYSPAEIRTMLGSFSLA